MPVCLLQWASGCMCACLSVAVGEWLQFDVGPPALVTAVVTRGRGGGDLARHTRGAGSSRQQWWVTRYQLSYSNSSRGPWHVYRDAPHLPNKVSTALQVIPIRQLLVIALVKPFCAPRLLRPGAAVPRGTTGENLLPTGNKSVPIELAQCRFPGLVIFNAKL